MSDHLLPLFLAVFISLVRGCHGDSYTITGLVVSSACAVTLLIVVIIIAVFVSVWANFLKKYYKKRGIRKSPRIEYIKKRNRSLKATLSKQQDLEMQIQAQQKLRPKLPNTWRAGDGQPFQQSSPRQNGDVVSGHYESYSATGDFNFGAEDIIDDEYATVQKPRASVVKESSDIPVIVRNYNSVKDLPEKPPERPNARSSQHSHMGIINPEEMVEIDLEEGEKSTHF
ncbi:uncharacterized protein LOC111118394 [Crassostrea virginica]